MRNSTFWQTNFIKNITGNLTIPILILFPVLAAIVFFALDSTKTMMDYQGLRNAVDRATLSVAHTKGMSEGETHKKLTEMIKSNLGANAEKLSEVIINTDYRTKLKVKATLKVRTLLGTFLNGKERLVSWETIATKKTEAKKLQIVLVIDNSDDTAKDINPNRAISPWITKVFPVLQPLWNQAGLNKNTILGNFKILALQIADLVKKGGKFEDSRVRSYIYNNRNSPVNMAIVPFATYVNTGYRYYKYIKPNVYIEDEILTMLSLQKQTFSNMKGNLWIDYWGNYNENIAYIDTIFNSLWYKNPGQSVSRYYGCIYELEPNRDILMQRIIQNWKIIKQNQFIPQFDFCSTVPMLRMGFGYPEISKRISSMTSENGRNVTVGMLWAYRHLSSYRPFVNLFPFKDKNTKKIVVLMTSGLNRHHAVGAYGRWSGGYLTSKGSGYVGGSRFTENDLNHWLDNRLLTVCKMLKDQDVEVFVVKSTPSATEQGDSSSSIKRYLEKCASKPENVYAVSRDGAQGLIERLKKYVDVTKKSADYVTLAK